MKISENTIEKIKSSRLASSILKSISDFKTFVCCSKKDKQLEELNGVLKVVSTKKKISLQAYNKLRDSKKNIESNPGLIKEVNKNLRKPVLFIPILPRNPEFINTFPEEYVI
jgi:hypothetical protein